MSTKKGPFATASATVAAMVAVAAVGAATPVTKAQYKAMLKRGNAQVGKVEQAAEPGLAINAEAAEMRRLILAWAGTERRFGKSFQRVRLPASAASANALLARGEITFASELTHAANHLPSKASAVGSYLERTLGHASGPAMIDRALTRLKAAGY